MLKSSDQIDLLREKKSKVLEKLFREACMDHGKRYHPRGDFNWQLPRFATLKIREANNRREVESERNEIIENLEGYFILGSSHSRGKEAW